MSPKEAWSSGKLKLTKRKFGSYMLHFLMEGQQEVQQTGGKFWDVIVLEDFLVDPVAIFVHH